MADPRRRNWTTIIYPDSCPDWQKVIDELHLPCLVSPLHDSDVNPDGTVKKPHYHLVMSFLGKKSQEQIQEISDKFSGVLVEPVKDMRSMARYLCHLDNPEKAQYSPDEVYVAGGLDYLSMIESAADTDEALKEIIAFCREQGIDSFQVLVDYAAANRSDWFRVITSKRTNFLVQYLKSVTWTQAVGQAQNNPFTNNSTD